MKSIFKKTLCSIMLFCLLFLCVGVVTKVSAADKWQLVTDTSSIPTGEVVILGKYKDEFYAMSNNNGTSKAPSALKLESDYSNITASYIWTISESNGSYTISPQGNNNTFLYTTKDNNGVRVGTNSNKQWSYTIDANKISFNLKCAGTNRYLTVYNGQDFRCYTKVYKESSSSQQKSQIYFLTKGGTSTTEPSISINVSSTNLKIKDILNVETKFSNFDTTPTTINWTTTDESKVSISNDGQLKGIAMGSAKIYAEVVNGENTIKSNEINVKVWPDNSTTISHDMARSICEFTESDATPFDYIIEGYVISISGKNVNLGETKDATTTFLLYNLNNYSQLKVGDYIAATGKLKTYNSTPEMDNGGTYEKFYNVVFNVDGAEYKILEKVINGSTIEAPEEPKKDGYTFVGWFNGDDMWDFENDTVSSSLTLEAKFVNSVHDNVQNALNLLNPYLSLGYTITTTTAGKEIVEECLTADDTPVSTYTVLPVKKDIAIYQFYSTVNSNRIQINNNTKGYGIVTTASKGIAKKIVIEFGSDNKNTLQVYGTNDAYSGTSDLYSNSTKGTLIGSLTNDSNSIEITDKYQYLGLVSSKGVIYISSITITWEAETTTYDSNFKLRVGIDDSIATVFDSITKDSSKTYEYGIQVSSSSVEGFSEKVKQYALTEESTKDGNIYYLIIDLEDLMNNPERLNIEFTVQAYAKIDDEILLSTNSKTYSVASLIEYYYSNEATKDLVKDAYDLLKSVGAIK